MVKRLKMNSSVEALMAKRREACACFARTATGMPYCVGLDVDECKGRDCAHYKSFVQVQIEQVKCQERFNSLPDDLIANINEKYGLHIKKEK